MSQDNIFFWSTSLKQMFFYNSKLNLSHGFYFTSLKTTNEVKCCMEWDIAFMLLKIKRRTSCPVEFCMFALLFSSIILFESSQIFPEREQVLLKRKCQEKTFQGSDRHFQVCSNFISHVCTPLNISCYSLKTQVYWNCLSVKCRVPNIIWHVGTHYSPLFHHSHLYNDWFKYTWNVCFTIQTNCTYFSYLIFVGVIALSSFCIDFFVM